MPGNRARHPVALVADHHYHALDAGALQLADQPHDHRLPTHVDQRLGRARAVEPQPAPGGRYQCLANHLPLIYTTIVALC
jgi:hypothetical protein